MDRRSFIKNYAYLLGGLVGGGLPALIGGFWFGNERGYEEGYDDGERAGEEAEEEPGPFHTEIRNIDREETIEPESFISISLDLKKETYYRYRFNADSNVDVMIMERSSFETYSERDGGEYMRFHSSMDTTRGNRSTTLAEGDYNLVIDNTSENGYADPTGPVEVNWVFQATQK